MIQSIVEGYGSLYQFQKRRFLKDPEFQKYSSGFHCSTYIKLKMAGSRNGYIIREVLLHGLIGMKRRFR